MKRTISIAIVLLAIVMLGSPVAAVSDMGELADGSLIKSDEYAAVYYYSDGNRYVFPDSKTYFSWYDDFSGVVTVTSGLLADIPLGGNVTYRPGKLLVKIISSPMVYAVERGGVLRWVKNETAAREMYGTDWRYQVRDIPDAFFVNYRTEDRPVESGSDFSPSGQMAGAADIRTDKGLTGTPAPTPSPSPAPEPEPDPTPVPTPTGISLIQASDFEYRGTFRLPTHPEWMGWEWGGDAMTHYPAGDSTGPTDGYPGSLFGTGHAWNMSVSEVTIPAPIISATKDPVDLNRAVALQDFTDVRGGLFDPFVEIIRVGMEYMPENDKLHLAWGQHFQETGTPEDIPSHMWCDVDLSSPDTRGSWWVADGNNYSTNDYMFGAPVDWAAAYTGGRTLITGRYRDGGWSGQGPPLFAVAPWQDGNPPAPGSRLGTTTLLQYDTSYVNDALFSDTARTMDGYHHTDTWTGAAWLSAGNRAAVAIVGTKGLGDYWYGDINGPCLDCALSRGWWSTEMVAQLIMYDPADLAAVAAGTMESWEPQPYATVDLEPFMFRNGSDQVMFQVGAMAFDRDNSLMYIFETLADEDRPLVHVWKVN
ncbi:MAG: hypothetical protein U9Q03_04925 [Patescibacteria group bacterium]|nr:hypothetical protein [Patescibacteria group bacterium]